jgi:hypothetical protein
VDTSTEKKVGVAELANKLYEEKLRASLEPDNIGKIIAIEPDSGGHVLGLTLEEIDEACQRRFGTKPVHVFRIGGRGAVKIMGSRRIERVS